MTGACPDNDTEAEARAGRIRDLNDALRRGEHVGMVMISSDVAAFGRDFATAALELVATFDAFSLANDPYGEHDFGMIALRGERLFWKIDYYDLALSQGAEDPSDESTCRRVLTLMTAQEY